MKIVSSNSSDDTFLPSPAKRCRVLSDSEKSSSSSLFDMIRASSVRRLRIESDSESEVEDDDNDENDIQEKECDINWRNPLVNQTKITFSNSPGINTHHSEIFNYTEPHSFYFFLLRMKYSKLSQIKRTYVCICCANNVRTAIVSSR